MFNIPFAVVDDVFIGASRLVRGAKGDHSSNPFKGTLGWAGLDIALSGAMAPSKQMLGHMFGAGAGFTASTLAWHVSSKAVGRAVSFGAKRALVGAVGKTAARGLLGGAGGIVGLAAAYAVDRVVREPLTKAYAAVTREARLTRHFNAGGDYEDTQVAYTQRQRAVQELSQSLLNARMYLGKESVLMHE